MDFPKSVPSVGLVGGSFVDENPSTGQPGSLIPAVWGNSVTYEILSVIRASGLEPDETKYNQLLEAIGGLHTFDRLVGKPTTLGGYGITDGLKRGDYGLGTNSAPVAKIDTVGLPGGFYFFGGGNTGLGNYVSLVNVPYGDNRYAAQMAFKQGADEPEMLVRTCKAEGVFGPARVVWHSGNFTPGDYLKAGSVYSKPQIDGMLATKANNAITLGGYGITDAYTKVEVNTSLALKANSADVYTKVEVNTSLALKANSSDVYTKTEVNTALSAKADKDKALVVGAVSLQQPILASPVAGGNYGAAALIVREALEAGAGDLREIMAPGIGFHWSGQTAGKLAMDSVGKLKWNGLPLLQAEVATQNEVDTGSTDSTVVTPFKLRYGFSFLKGGAAGASAIAFPTWLGGFVVQWGVHAADIVESEQSVTFPVRFAVAPCVVSTFTHNGAMTQSRIVTQTRLVTETGFTSRREDVEYPTTLPGFIRWLAVGYL